MVYSNSDTGPRESEQVRPEDRRAQWERPALRRLAVDKAEHGSSVGNDGVGGGGGGPSNHS